MSSALHEGTLARTTSPLILLFDMLKKKKKKLSQLQNVLFSSFLRSSSVCLQNPVEDIDPRTRPRGPIGSSSAVC